jgi:hypothetical protein
VDSYKKIAKNLLIKEHAWDRNFGEPLPTLEDVMNEAESMQLQPKGGGKTVKFTDKDNYEKAKKSGDYEEPEETDDDGEDKPAANVGADDAQLGGDRSADAGDDKGGEEPSDDEFDQDTVNQNAFNAIEHGEGENWIEEEDPSTDEMETVLRDLQRKGYRKTDDDPFKTGPETVQKYIDALKSGKSMKYGDKYDMEDDERDTIKKKVGTMMNQFVKQNPIEEPSGEQGGKELGKNETLKINGKMYRKVQEQKETSKKHPLREAYERIGGK